MFNACSVRAFVRNLLPPCDRFASKNKSCLRTSAQPAATDKHALARAHILAVAVQNAGRSADKCASGSCSNDCYTMVYTDNY